MYFLSVNIQNNYLHTNKNTLHAIVISAISLIFSVLRYFDTRKNTKLSEQNRLDGQLQSIRKDFAQLNHIIKTISGDGELPDTLKAKVNSLLISCKSSSLEQPQKDDLIADAERIETYSLSIIDESNREKQLEQLKNHIEEFQKQI